MLKNFNYFIVSFSIAVLLMNGLNMFLKKSPLQYLKNSKEYSFFMIDLPKLFFVNKVKKVKKVVKEKYEKLDIKLKSIYLDGNNSFIIIEDRGKTYFVNLNDTYKSYKLVKIEKDRAIFTRNDKKFIIKFKKIIGTVLKTDNNKNSFVENSRNQTILKTIKKSIFNEYKSNQVKIWQNIGMVKNIKGYKITFLKTGSIFDKMGLRVGDTIVKVNGRELKNDDDAWDLYQNSDKFTGYEIVIIRNNIKKVLNYEVK